MIEFFNPPDAPAPGAFSRATRAAGLIFVSGTGAGNDIGGKAREGTAAEQTREDCAGLTMLDVERQAFLRAIGPDEMRREPAHALVVAAREIAAAGTLDLDDARAEVGELARAEWPRDRVLERDDGDAFQREEASPRSRFATSPLRGASALGRPGGAHL